jgi:hypothetical protein
MLILLCQVAVVKALAAGTAAVGLKRKAFEQVIQRFF